MEKNETLSTYKIPSSNLGILQERVEKLNKRGKRLGMEPIRLSKTGVEEIREVQWDDSRKVQVRFIEVELQGATPKLAGWTFVATLQRLAGDSGEQVTILRSVPGQELPEAFRSAPQICDHCNTSRMRRDTYVVRSEQGEHKQVGSSCLKDFLGHADPHQLAAWAELLGAFHHEMLSEDEDGWSGRMGGGEAEWPLEDYLVVAALVCRVSGWVSRKRANEDERVVATADICEALTFAWRRLSNDDKRELENKYGTELFNEAGLRTGFAFGTEAHKQTAEEALDWVRGFRNRAESLSDYEHNLLALATVGTVPMRAQGIAASIVGSYLRHTDQLTARAAKSNEWIGTEGERQELELKVVSVTGYESSFGEGDRISFEDALGNSFVWFTRARSGFEASEELTKFKFTVKSHREYQGRKQTGITRVAEVVAKAPRAAGRNYKFERVPHETVQFEIFNVSLKREQLGQVRWMGARGWEFELPTGEVLHIGGRGSRKAAMERYEEMMAERAATATAVNVIPDGIPLEAR